MATATVITQLQAVHAAIAGITSAPTSAIRALNAADLPTVLVYPGPAQHARYAIGMRRVERIYRVRLFVRVLGDSVEADYLPTITTFLDLFAAAYLTSTNVTLGGSVEHIQTERITDSGLTILDHGARDYHGVEWAVPVVEKVDVA